MSEASRMKSKFAFAVLFVIPTIIGITARSIEQQSLVDEVIQILVKSYVNPKNIDLDAWASNARGQFMKICPTSTPCSSTIAERILNNLLLAIGDPHLGIATYDADIVNNFETLGVTGHGSRYGIKVSAQKHLVVTFVQPDSFAKDIGVVVGDRIMSVNSVENDPISLENRLIVAERNKKTVSVILESREHKRRTVQLKTEGTAIWYPSLQKMNKDTAVLALPDLAPYETIDVAAHQKINEAKSMGIKKLVVDLRFNDGGASFVTIAIAGAFIDPVGRTYTTKQGISRDVRYKNGVMISQTTEKPGQTDERQILNPASWTGMVAVLTSKHTVSASENLADLLQHFKKAKVYGEETAGALGTTVANAALSTGGALQYSNTKFNNDDGTPMNFRIIPDEVIRFDGEALANGHDTQLEAALAGLHSMK
jgi:carboxyl-terminal processing protease